MKLTVLYHSVSGNTKQMAGVIAEGIKMVENAEAKTYLIEEIDEAWVKDSKCVVVGRPIFVSWYAYLFRWRCLRKSGDSFRACRFNGSFR